MNKRYEFFIIIVKGEKNNWHILICKGGRYLVGREGLVDVGTLLSPCNRKVSSARVG